MSVMLPHEGYAKGLRALRGGPAEGAFMGLDVETFASCT